GLLWHDEESQTQFPSASLGDPGMSMATCKEDHKTEDLQTALNTLQSLFDYLQRARVQGEALHVVEKEIWRSVLRMGRQALTWFLSQQGTGDVGEIVILKSGRTLRRLERLHS